MKRGIIPVFLTFLTSFVFTVETYCQCTDTADFTQWIEANSTGNWLVESSGKVTQNVEILPTRPAFFVSDIDLINVSFSFDIECQDGNDDDFIGFVAGFRNPFSSSSDQYNFLLFDWKSTAENGFNYFAEEGYTLAEYSGSVTDEEIHKYFWGHNAAAVNSSYEQLAHSYGLNKGWRFRSIYHVKGTYTESAIKIWIDGNLVFDVKRCNQPGRIGFYTYSQYKISFSNFSYGTTAELFVEPDEICAGDTVFASIYDPECPAYDPALESWQWNWGDGSYSQNKLTDYHIYQAGGNYQLEMVARFPGGCSDTLQTIIKVQQPPEIDLGPDTTIFINETIVLTAGNDNPGWTYLWSNDTYMPTLTINNLARDTLISLLVTSSFCQAYDEILIRVIPYPVSNHKIWVPNVFSPDGDGYNDIFKPVIYDEIPKDYSLLVYDKWGTEIFQTSSTDKGWDGTYKGNQCHGDVYVYLIRYKLNENNADETLRIEKGNVLLLK